MISAFTVGVSRCTSGWAQLGAGERRRKSAIGLAEKASTRSGRRRPAPRPPALLAAAATQEHRHRARQRRGHPRRTAARAGRVAGAGRDLARGGAGAGAAPGALDGRGVDVARMAAANQDDPAHTAAASAGIPQHAAVATGAGGGGLDALARGARLSRRAAHVLAPILAGSVHAHRGGRAAGHLVAAVVDAQVCRARAGLAGSAGRALARRDAHAHLADLAIAAGGPAAQIHAGARHARLSLGAGHVVAAALALAPQTDLAGRAADAHARGVLAVEIGVAHQAGRAHELAHAALADALALVADLLAGTRRALVDDAVTVVVQAVAHLGAGADDGPAADVLARRALGDAVRAHALHHGVAGDAAPLAGDAADVEDEVVEVTIAGLARVALPRRRRRRGVLEAEIDELGWAVD